MYILSSASTRVSHFRGVKRRKRKNMKRTKNNNNNNPFTKNVIELARIIIRVTAKISVLKYSVY